MFRRGRETKVGSSYYKFLFASQATFNCFPNPYEMWYWNLATRSPRPPIPFLSALALGLSRSPRTVIQCWWVSPEMPQGWRWNRIGTNRTGLYTHVTIWGGSLSNSPASSVQATAFSQPEAITTTPSSLSRTRSTVRFTSNIRKCICSERGREREKDEGKHRCRNGNAVQIAKSIKSRL